MLGENSLYTRFLEGIPRRPSSLLVFLRFREIGIFLFMKEPGMFTPSFRAMNVGNYFLYQNGAGGACDFVSAAGLGRFRRWRHWVGNGRHSFAVCKGTFSGTTAWRVLTWGPCGVLMNTLSRQPSLPSVCQATFICCKDKSDCSRSSGGLKVCGFFLLTI